MSAGADLVVLRPLEPTDDDLVVEVFEGLGPESRFQRFLVPKQRLSASDLRQLTSVDHWRHEAVIAISVADGRPVGIGRFVRERHDHETAEMAITVVDAWHERGVGSLLIDALVARADDLAIKRFSVLMARDNHGAARLLRRIPGDRDRVGFGYDTAEFLVQLPTAC